MAMKKIDWRMECDVNGSKFEFNGQGEGDSNTGLVELNLKSTGFPAGFEPVSCPCICNAPGTIGFAREDESSSNLFEIAGSHINVQPSRCGSVFNAKGEELLRLSVSSVVKVEDDCISVGNAMSGFSKLPPLEKNLTPSDEYIIPHGKGNAVSMLKFKLLAKSGEILTGMTMVPYVWEGEGELDNIIIRRYESINVDWDGGVNVLTTVKSAIVSEELAREARAFIGQTTFAQA
jgi:hypothetical protein